MIPNTLPLLNTLVFDLYLVGGLCCMLVAAVSVAIYQLCNARVRDRVAREHGIRLTVTQMDNLRFWRTVRTDDGQLVWEKDTNRMLLYPQR